MEKLNAPTSLESSSSEDLDNICIDHELVDLDDIPVAPQKPHFLDYDAIAPPGFEDNLEMYSKLLPSTSISCPGENVKVDKKYEKDGEISDYELAASGATKKEFKSQRKFLEDNERMTGVRKKKHFLDENPIPPDYMLEKDREHRSLDRNFERQREYECLRYERKHSLDREMRSRKIKEPSYTLSRFIEGESLPACHATWPSDRPSENVMNFSSTSSDKITNLGPKVECVYSLLSMLGSHDSIETSKKFLELSRTTETCATLRRSGCIPLLVQMMHSDSDEGARRRAAMALHNVVHCHPDDKAGRREAKVLRLIEQIMEYCNFLKTFLVSGGEAIADDTDRHPLPAICSLMKVSFDEEHRHAMCQLGALQAIASLVHLDHAVHGPKPEDQCCNPLRRYALMALTNLTFGDGNNKALLCANKEFMEALVAQLDSAPDDLLQVTASVLRNLSWRADNNMKGVLNEIGTVTALTRAAMKNKNENTLKAILSALWNLSAHCSTNKAELCAVEGALAFLVDMLCYEGPSKTLKIIENAGGILRNVSSHIAVREDYRKILRHRNCLGILLQQLKSESLTVVSNACGTLWNLSARFPEDQKYLWDNGAVPMLRSLIHSKHKMISEGSSAALKNLLNFRPSALNPNNLDPIAKSMGLKELPTLNARKQRALEQELNRNLAETCDNLDAVTPTKEKNDFNVIDGSKSQLTTTRLTRSAIVSKSESRDSIVSAKSDSVYEKFRRGHSAPPCHESQSKEIKSSKTFGIRNNFVESGFDIEQEAEQPIDYSAKYDSENVAAQKIEQPHSQKIEQPHSVRKNETRNYTTYQETDLDQLTDFSLRYAENQVESDIDEKVAVNSGNEIILILEDTVKCYQTEGTPYAISNAASVSDLRNTKVEEPVPPTKNVAPKPELGYGSGTYTPEKPINYCEEGTPGYFSRYESLSSLDESPPNCNNIAKAKPEVVEEECIPDREQTQKGDQKTEINKTSKGKMHPTISVQSSGIVPNKAVAAVNSAQETPLMFSRRSSMDSLASAEPNTADDKSSVVSDFSRLASGVISPSELPDSPTQSMPQSPSRSHHAGPAFSNAPSSSTAQRPSGQQRLRSVFEDDINTFRVENTPAQFSCATSLSNLSLEDEPKIASDTINKEITLFNENSETKLDKADTEHVKLDKGGDSCVLSDAEEVNDDIILANCINIGMNCSASTSKVCHSMPNEAISHAKKTSNLQTKEINSGEDAVTQYYTEDTPALLSKVGSNSNLSVLSLYTSKCDTANLSDESSNTSDGNEILEQCIREGMQKSSSAKQKSFNEQTDLPQKISNKDPIAMLRRGGLSQYLPVKDEMNKFNVEDSPCNYSVISGLSDLTVGSAVAGLANIKSGFNSKETGIKTEKIVPECKQTGEDSLSSISAESEDDTNLLSQAIAAGYSKPKIMTPFSVTNNISIPGPSKRPQDMGAQTCNVATLPEPTDSLSSIDSSDSNDNQAKSLLEQCIRSGMIKDKKTEKTVEKTIISPKKSQLPLLNFISNDSTTQNNGRNRQKDRERKDKQLLMECINTGISKNVRFDAQIKPPTRHIRQVLDPSEFNNRVIASGVQQDIPKNGETTSVAVPEQQQLSEIITSQGAPNTAPDVGTREAPGGTDKESRNQIPPNQLSIQNKIGFDNIEKTEILQLSSGSLNLSLDGHNILDQSNEYPALKLSNIDYTDTVNTSSFEMEVSNEFLIENDINDVHYPPIQKIDKHKDPDLMLKSVERLTHELVSTAEFLRTSASNKPERNLKEFDTNSLTYEKKSGSNSNSNNTWNEDTCPNDMSFPSISITAPMVASLNDDEATFSDFNQPETNIHGVCEITPTNENAIFTTQSNGKDAILNELEHDTKSAFVPESQPNSLETETDTLVNDEFDINSKFCENKCNWGGSGIAFHVGGEVQQFNASGSSYLSSGPRSFEITSAMTNSAIIAMEANKLADQLMKNNMHDSTISLDLDNVRPPSGMECLSMSGYFECPKSPQLSRLRKKSLPAGLIARRALGCGQAVASGSVESVNSSCNLDNIKPPSLMDELLDSMISVASITSEIVDSSLGTRSNYETAFSDVDENTTTLQSCMEVFSAGYDSNRTPTPSDFSSAESTPRKNRSHNTSIIDGVKRTLTPKQKRKIVKDRYRTYTIAADFVLKENFDEVTQSSSSYVEDDEIIKIEIEHDPNIKNQEKRDSQLNCETSQAIKREDIPLIKRRSLDPDRFKTRTIVFDNDMNAENILQEVPKPLTEQESVNSTEDDTEEMTSIRALTKRFTYINDAEVGNVLKDNTTSISQSASYIARVMAEETRTTESELNSIEYDQNSETESCDQNVEKFEDEENCSKKTYKPRILKPSDKYSNVQPFSKEETEAFQEIVKAVRGRKKPVYVSPYRRSVASTGSSKTTSPKPPPTNISRTNLAAKIPSPDLKKCTSAKLALKGQTIVAKTHVFVNKTSTNKISSSNLAKPNLLGNFSKRNVVTEKNLINKRLNGEKNPTDASGKQVQENPSGLERQGTFVKEEPSTAEVPVVTSSPVSPAKSSKLPTKTQPQKLPNAANASTKLLGTKIKVPLQKSASMDVTSKLSLKTNIISTRQQTAASARQLTATSTRQINLPISSEVNKRKNLSAIRKSPSIPAVPQRSNSNTLIRPTLETALRHDLPSTNPPSRSNSNLSNPRINATSRIAGIWKKTDESKKNLQLPKPQASKTTITSSSKLIRSSTFNNMSADDTGESENQVNIPSCSGAPSKPEIGISRIRPPKIGTSRPKDDSSSNVIRRVKTTQVVERTTKRNSRLGTFINVEGGCQVAG